MTPAWRHPLAEDPGPIVVPLADPRCREAGFAGSDVALLVRLWEHVQVPPTVVVVGHAAGWGSTDWSSLPEQLGGSATIRGWLVRPQRETRRIGPVWYNIVPAAVDESVVELAALAARTAGGDRAAYVVVSLQLFVPAEVSMTATVDTAGAPVRLRFRWGLDESPKGESHQGVMELSGPELTVAEYQVSHQATATAAAPGGTQIVEVPPRMRGKSGLSVEQARGIARICQQAARRLGRGVELEMAISGRTPYLLACRCL